MSFRLEHITVADRMTIAAACLLAPGEYGLVTGLARTYETSRQFIYDLRDRARAALAQACAPGTPGRPAVDQRLVVDPRHLDRAILTLHQVAHAPVRAIQACLDELLRVARSVGSIQAVLTQAAQRARALLPTPGQPVQADADEVFAGGAPVLEVVDRRSGLVVALELAPSRDETAWGCTFLDLQARGVQVANLAADGGTGLRAGARAAGLPAPRLDHWHTLRDLGRHVRALEAEAYRWLERAERAQRAVTAETHRQQHGRRPRRGRPLQEVADPARVAAAAQAAALAVQRADGAALLVAMVREALHPVDPTTGQVRTAPAVAADLLAAAALLRELGGRAVTAARLLEARAPALAAYLDALQAALAGPRAVLGEAGVTSLAWAWQHRQALALPEAAAAWPAAPDLARAVWVALDGAARATGMAENLNSLLAPHRAARRGLPATCLRLFQVYRNHHVFARGKRAGQSPLQLAGAPSPDWLEALGYGRPDASAQRQFPVRRAQSVNTLPA